MFMGPDDFNGYGYFSRTFVLDRSWFPGPVIEEYMLLCALSHISAYEKGGACFKEFCGPFFFASSGFGSDFSQIFTG